MRAAGDHQHPLPKLAADEELWLGTGCDELTRLQVLKLIAAGTPAIACASMAGLTGFQGNAAFGRVTISGTDWIIPHRFLRMFGFFTASADTLPAAGDARSRLLHGGNCLLTGGPGTGKSYHISQLIGDLAENSGNRPLRVIITAPTGKAAARFAHLQSGANLLVEWATVHRLLGISSDLGEPKFHARNPLGCDLLIIDEISMLDLGLFASLVDALPAHARVVIAGDLAQLPAVEGFAIDTCLAFLREQKLVDHIALTKVFRFSEAKAAMYGKIATGGVASLPTDNADIAVRQFARPAEIPVFVESLWLARLATPEANELRSAIAGCKPGSAQFNDLAKRIFAWLRESMVLTSRREGALGSTAICARIDRSMKATTAGRTLVPVIAARNNYHLGIFNGDTGFIASWDGREFAVIEASQGEAVVVPLPELPGWELAYAITIHKSQGSEYGDVFVVYEEGESAATGDYRLLYTAVTRARNQATVLIKK